MICCLAPNKLWTHAYLKGILPPLLDFFATIDWQVAVISVILKSKPHVCLSTDFFNAHSLHFRVFSFWVVFVFTIIILCTMCTLNYAGALHDNVCCVYADIFGLVMILIMYIMFSKLMSIASASFVVACDMGYSYGIVI